MQNYDLESAAHVVQQALTPVFLLSGIAALLNVFASRLARVADKVDALSIEPKDLIRDQRLKVLKLRSHALDWAVVLAALGGASTCAAVLVCSLDRCAAHPAPICFSCCSAGRSFSRWAL